MEFDSDNDSEKSGQQQQNGDAPKIPVGGRDALTEDSECSSTGKMSVQNPTNTKRRRFHHPLQQKLLKLPTEEEWNSSKFDAYESPVPFSFSKTHHHPRPMPSSQILTSTIGTNDTSSGKAPILLEFFEALGVPTQQQQLLKGKNGNDDCDNDPNFNVEDNNSSKDDIDNPNFSMLTAGQHERYLKLMSSTLPFKSRPLAERKEFQSLSQIVQSEQARYRQAIYDFHTKHITRYNSTLDRNHAAYLFFQWACNATSTTRVMKSSSPGLSAFTKFGKKSLQSISLPQQQQQQKQMHQQERTSRNLTGRELQTREKLDLTSLDLRVVYRTETSLIPTTLDRSSFVGVKIPPPKASSTCVPISLSEDKNIPTLAQKHGASIVTTSETLQMLLKRPGVYGSRWMIPLCSYRELQLLASSSSSSPPSSLEDFDFQLLGPPVPQSYATPRECFEYGLEEGLYQMMIRREQGNEQNSSKDDDPNSNHIQYVYTLWTLPKIRRQSIRVLIRSIVRCQQTHTMEKGNASNTGMSEEKSKGHQNSKPLIIRTHVEYFWGRGKVEIPNSYERALWILDHLLFGNDATTTMGRVVHSELVRVDARDCRIVTWEEVSIAHALVMKGGDSANMPTGSFSGGNHHGSSNKHNNNLNGNFDEDDPMIHWELLIHILQSLSTINLNQASLLCLNDNQYSISVHGAVATSESFDGSVNNKKNNNNSKAGVDALIDLNHLSDSSSTGVMLTSEALEHCARDWIWDRTNRVPYTFPAKNEKGEKNSMG